MKKTYYKIRPIQDKTYWVTTEEQFMVDIKDYLDDAENELAISTIKMTEKEFEKLPEFEG